MTNTKSRVEVLTSPQRRRRWTPEEKKAIVDETYQPAIIVLPSIPLIFFQKEIESACQT